MTFFREKVNIWLADAASSMQDVAAAPPDALPNLVKGPALFPLDDGGGLEAKQINFETVPFPGSASADVTAILRFIHDVKPFKPTRDQGREEFAVLPEILDKVFSYHWDNPPLSKDGTALWIPHLDFLHKALAGAQQALVEHDRALTLMNLWETGGSGRPPTAKKEVEKRRDCLRRQLARWLDDLLDWEGSNCEALQSQDTVP